MQQLTEGPIHSYSSEGQGISISAVLMECPDENMTAAFIEGALAVDSRNELIEHLSDCAECRAVVASLAQESAIHPTRRVGSPSKLDTVRASSVQRLGESGGVEEPAVMSSGTAIGHFRVTGLLGRGGMGDVYAARDPELGRKVAIKLVRKRLADSDEALARFRREALTTAQFTHPNIVTVLAAGQHEGTPYVVLEYLEGHSLAEHLGGEKLPCDEVIRIGRSIASALREAHDNGILHRDLKPGNVHVDRRGHVRVLDFGLAKTFGEDEPEDTTGAAFSLEGEAVYETRASMVLGTPLYMAPEQWKGEPCTGAVDVWAVGLMFFEMSAGRLPFEVCRMIELAQEVCSEEPVPDLRSVLAEVPAGLADLVAACLQKDPKKRPSSQELVELLEALAVRQSRARVAASSAELPKRRELSEPRAAKRRARAGAAVAFISLGGLLAWAFSLSAPESSGSLAQATDVEKPIISATASALPSGAASATASAPPSGAASTAASAVSIATASAVPTSTVPSPPPRPKPKPKLKPKPKGKDLFNERY